jgi:hypothetical protein
VHAQLASDTSSRITPAYQASESAYLLVKARRLRDATLKLSHAAAQAAVSSAAAACLGGRVERGEVLPEVEVRGVLLRHTMEGMATELTRELMHM